jgi:hypothetical protein
VFFGTPSCRYLPRPDLTPHVIVCTRGHRPPGTGSGPCCGGRGACVLRLPECGQGSPGAIRSSIRGDAYGAAMNELEEWRA